MRFLDASDHYHHKTQTMAPGPSHTFICGACGKYCTITGRKVISRDGNRRKYACVKCQKEKNVSVL